MSRVTDMNRMFAQAKSFKRDISKWDVSRVTDMHCMFSDAISFTGDISKWHVSHAEDMSAILGVLYHSTATSHSGTCPT